MLLSLQLIATSLVLALGIVVVVYALVTGSPPLASTARVRRATARGLAPPARRRGGPPRLAPPRRALRSARRRAPQVGLPGAFTPT